MPETPRPFETYERASMVIDYVVGPSPIRKGGMVGLNEEGLLVPIDQAECFVGVAYEGHSGAPETRRNVRVNVATVGSFVYALQGHRPTYRDLHREVWAFSDIEVSGRPLRTPLLVGRVVGIEETCDRRPGLRVKIDAATGLAHARPSERVAERS